MRGQPDLAAGEAACVAVGGDQQRCVSIKGLRTDDAGIGGTFRDPQIRLPADAQATELANAYNLLMAKAEDPADTLELKSLLPWLETQLTKTLKKALKEPGAGKREA